ncbi:MAG: amidohydrolase family protein [Planctomycetes bacterium]|nr:amidohydrolase family protein [Planctomycetota bacterium]
MSEESLAPGDADTAPEDPAPASPDPAPSAEGEQPKKKRGFTRRRVLGLAVLGGLAFGAKNLFWIPAPPRLESLTLGAAGEKVLATAWEGVDPSWVLDTHVHLIGLGAGGTGCILHKDATSLTSPYRYVQTRFYKGAAGIYDDARADALYVERLVDLCTHHRGRALLLAFDKHYSEKGEPVVEHTEFYTPNDYLFRIVAEHPELFVPCASVHPYRPDALEELAKVAEQGAVGIKWLPNAMGMDPLAERCQAFFERMAELKLVLVSHAGEEQAVEAEEAQELGNPLRLRRALDAGVTVVVAHCASLGKSDDLDAPKDTSGHHPRRSAYRLFRRMLTEPRAKGLLFGDVSAMTQFNRSGAPLAETLRDAELHGSLVNGSDYPLPGIDPLIRTGLLVRQGYLTEEERAGINQLFVYNPLAFDFAAKRLLRAPTAEGAYDPEGKRLPARVFEAARAFPRLANSS